MSEKDTEKKTGFTMMNLAGVIIVILILACLIIPGTKKPQTSNSSAINAAVDNVVATAPAVEVAQNIPVTHAASTETENSPPSNLVNRLDALISGDEGALKEAKSASPETVEAPAAKEEPAAPTPAASQPEVAAVSEPLPDVPTDATSPCTAITDSGKETPAANEETGKISAGDLDGKSFVGKIGKMGALKSSKDIFVFENGKFYSGVCKALKLDDSAYQLTPEGGETNFDAQTKSPNGNVVKWRGVVKANNVEGKAIVLKTGEPDQEYWFLGKLVASEHEEK